MKELSIEEKAKRYDEAIRESSKIINHCAGGANIPECISVKATIEQIFPELKESEDEKIRKAIYNCVNWFGFDSCYFKDITQEECLAWLEKQGEQNLANSAKTCEDEKIRKEIISALKYANYKGVYDKHLAWLEKQGEQNLANSAKTCEDEQKPAELDENGESILTPFEAELFSMMSDAWQGYQRGEEVNIAAIVKEHSAELLERAYEQKPVEWSEEDRIKCNGTIHLLENLIREGYFDSDDVQVASDLKFACKGLINWLKSLKDRYTWKPSGEQMEALKGVLEGAFRLDILESLYQDLKKLKEG